MLISPATFLTRRQLNYPDQPAAAMFIPNALLKRLYTFGSLENTDRGVQFSIKNRLHDAQLTAFNGLKIDGEPIADADVALRLDDGRVVSPGSLSDEAVDFPLRRTLEVLVEMDPLNEGQHELEVSFTSKPFGALDFSVEDEVGGGEDQPARIPRSETDDHTEEAVQKRRSFVKEFTGHDLEHVSQYSFAPSATQGNVENLIGAAQVPLGLAGPLTVHGEHAEGDYLIPLATSEGTLVASYNRGMKVLNLSGGVTCTVMGDAMQRAPVFAFENARESRDFTAWVERHTDAIRNEAEATSNTVALQYIDPYLSNRFAYLRFNYSTGDAAGQNMVGRATQAACEWIIEHYEDDKIRHFYLESNLATDKKNSRINMLHPRGKRVTAEATLDRSILIERLGVNPETLHHHGSVSTVGAFLSGSTNNGAHSANAVTALFIATGQDVANVSESSSAILYSEVTPEGDLYASLTIPSLIVATYGGGTGLPTQRECLELMDCYGKGKVRKFAEIVAGVALAGEVSLGAAISSSDWVSSHETYGRNR